MALFSPTVGFAKLSVLASTSMIFLSEGDEGLILDHVKHHLIFLRLVDKLTTLFKMSSCFSASYICLRRVPERNNPASQIFLPSATRV
jgi:hypothetical protein